MLKSPSRRASASGALFRSEQVYVCLLLVWGGVHGLVYLGLIPPWQHYDEPAHFERLYWLTEFISSGSNASRALSIPAEITASMCEFHFWPDGVCSPLPAPYEIPPTWQSLGLSGQPLYYFCLVPLQLIFQHSSVEFRLYLGRLVSVVLYVLTLFVAYLTLRDLFPEDPEIRFVVPLLIASIPAFADLMSALNNDVGAVLVFSVFLWATVRLMRDGLSWLSLTWLGGMVVLGWFTKKTTMVGLPLAIGAVLLSCRAFKWWGWLIASLCGLVLVFSAFSWTGSASWYELGSPGGTPTRVSSSGPLGDHILCVGEQRYLAQELPPDQVKGLRGQTVTLGGWVRTRSTSPSVSEMAVDEDVASYTKGVTATLQWTFNALTTTISSRADSLQVRLGSPAGLGVVCYDGLVMARGQFPLDEPPRFESGSGKKGIWGAEPFVNILSNGSAERVWPQVKPWASERILKSGLTHGLDPTIYLQSILDWRRTGWVYWAVYKNIWQSFWARFGWNGVAWPGFVYQALGILTGAGIAGVLVKSFRGLVLVRSALTWRRRVAILWALAVGLVWGGAMIWYSHPILSNLPRIFYAVARYVYPAIIPVVTFLYLGWRQVLPGKWKRFLPVLSLTGLICLDLGSLLGVILPFYYSR